MTGAVAVMAASASPFTVTASPDLAIGNAPGFTNLVTATPDGGFAPYTYLWVIQSGSGDAISPTSASTRFGGGVSSGTWVCAVTDNVGRTYFSNLVTVDIS